MSTAGTRLVDKYKLEQAIPPLNYTGAAATSMWLSLENYYHATIIIQTGAWAGGTAAVTLNQSWTIAGTNSKAIAFDTMFTNAGSTPADALVSTPVVSNTFNLSAANSLYIIELNGYDLDINNTTYGPFAFFQVAIATPGSNADNYGVQVILGNMPRFAGNYSVLPSALS